jgi:hypothetical protein
MGVERIELVRTLDSSECRVSAECLCFPNIALRNFKRRYVTRSAVEQHLWNAASPPGTPRHTALKSRRACRRAGRDEISRQLHGIHG